MDRGTFKWRMAVGNDGILPYNGAFPSLIEWKGQEHPCDHLKNANLSLNYVLITHPEAKKLNIALKLFFDKRVVIKEDRDVSISLTLNSPTGNRYIK